MGNAFFVPFNFQPVNTGAGNEGSTYTVPSGKYARVTITMCVSAYARNAFLAAQSESADSNSTSNAVTLTIFMDDGEALTFSATAANTSDTGGSGNFSISDDSVISARVDGVDISQIRCHAAIHGFTSAGTHSVYIDGTAEANFRYEEYNKIS